MTNDVLQSKLAHLPDSPGVYLFKNEQGDIIYIGKAAVLADRVRSYFQKGADHSPKTSLARQPNRRPGNDGHPVRA